MSKDQPRRTGPHAVPDESPADKSPRALNKALDTLDDLLAGSKGARADKQPAPALDPEPGRDPHTLSLLDPVENNYPADPEEADAMAPPGIADDVAYQQLADRLASELEIIVQTGVAEALQQAGETIVARVKDHLDIMLPEILQELADIEARKTD